MKKKPLNYHEKFTSFYNSPEWKNLRNRKFYASNGLCELCYKEGIIKEAREIHHIVPITRDWSKRLEYNNLISLCSNCHNKIHDRQSCLQSFLDFWETI